MKIEQVNQVTDRFRTLGFDDKETVLIVQRMVEHPDLVAVAWPITKHQGSDLAWGMIKPVVSWVTVFQSIQATQSTG